MFDIEAAQARKEKLLEIATSAETIKDIMFDRSINEDNVKLYNAAQRISDNVSPLLLESIEGNKPALGGSGTMFQERETVSQDNGPFSPNNKEAANA